MSALAKSQSLIKQLKGDLQKRFPATWLFSESSDAKGQILVINQDSAWATGEAAICIRILGVETQFDNGIGQAQAAYSPMKCQLIMESSTIAVIAVLSSLRWAEIASDLGRAGLRSELYLTANTVQPTAAMFSADGSVATATKQGDLMPDIKWPMSGQ